MLFIKNSFKIKGVLITTLPSKYCRAETPLIGVREIYIRK